MRHLIVIKAGKVDERNIVARDQAEMLKDLGYRICMFTYRIGTVESEVGLFSGNTNRELTSMAQFLHPLGYPPCYDYHPVYTRECTQDKFPASLDRVQTMAVENRLKLVVLIGLSDLAEGFLPYYGREVLGLELGPCKVKPTGGYILDCREGILSRIS